jgi:hypothetical protein
MVPMDAVRLCVWSALPHPDFAMRSESARGCWLSSGTVPTSAPPVDCQVTGRMEAGPILSRPGVEWLNAW